MGRHGVPDGEPPSAPDEQPTTGAWPDDDELTTLGRRTRAERRRDGQLPRGEDPMSGRGPGAPGADQPAGSRPPAQAGPRTYVTGIPAAPAPRPDVPRSDIPRSDASRTDGPRRAAPARDTAPPVSRGPATPPPPPPARGPGAPPPVRGPGTPPPPADRATRAQPTPPPPTRGLPTPVPPPAEQAPAAGGEGPRTSVDPLPGSRPPAARAPETSSLPAWATSLGPPTPPPGTETARETAPEPAPWTGPERRSADRPEGVPATGDRRGARTHSVPERPPLPSLPPPGPAAAPAPGPTAGPGTSPGAAAPAGRRSPERSTEPGSGETGVIGGRAASRAERQAVDVVRRREERRQGITPIPPLPDEGRRGSRGLVLGLVAAVVIALVLLGVWSFQRPGTEESASSAPATTSSAAPASSSQAPATSAPAPTSAVPTGPVFAPVTVLNATTVNGLAGAIGAALSAGGWEIRGEDSYTTGDVAVTTVFYTAGDVQQQAAAATLQAQFPDILGGPSERFFDVAGEPDPGIVVVATGNWQP